MDIRKAIGRIAHELGHSLALLHIFNQRYAKIGEVDNMEAPGLPGFVFGQRELDQEHLFMDGTTENMMHYDYKVLFDSSIPIYTVKTGEYKIKKEKEEEVDLKIAKGGQITVDDFRMNDAD